MDLGEVPPIREGTSLFETVLDIFGVIIDVVEIIVESIE